MQNEHTLFNIQGQIAVITGGSGGLGRAIAYALAGAGVRQFTRHFCGESG